MTTPLINPASIRISFLNEEGSLTEVSDPTLDAVAIAISAELQRRDRNYREPVIVTDDDDDDEYHGECDKCSSTEVSPGYTTMGMLCYDCKDAYRGHYTEAE